MTSHADLKRLAQNAHSAEWFVAADDETSNDEGKIEVWDAAVLKGGGPDKICECTYRHEAAFIAAANPAQVLALLDERDFQERSSDAFEDELERVHDQLWSTLKVLGIAAKPTPHHDLEHCTEQIKTSIVALLDRIERLEKVRKAARYYRRAQCQQPYSEMLFQDARILALIEENRVLRERVGELEDALDDTRDYLHECQQVSAANLQVIQSECIPKIVEQPDAMCRAIGMLPPLIDKLNALASSEQEKPK